MIRWVLWLLVLFAVAAVLALLVGNNAATLTVFWPPYRIDFSLNLVLLVLVLFFVVGYWAQAALIALMRIPKQALQWRLQLHERAMHAAYLEGMDAFHSGRYLRAQKRAQEALRLERHLSDESTALPHATRFRALSHLLLAEAAHGLMNTALRDQHAQDALLAARSHASSKDLAEGIQLRQARWYIDTRQAGPALEVLEQLPPGVSRRWLALRMKLKAARLLGRWGLALETARQLYKHKALSSLAWTSLMQELTAQASRQVQDVSNLERLWASMSAPEQQHPHIAMTMALRAWQLQPQGDPALSWLEPVWRLCSAGQLPEDQCAEFVLVLAPVLSAGFAADAGGLARTWLERVERAQAAQPQSPAMHYLAGQVYASQMLWGKARLHLQQAAQSPKPSGLKPKAWQALAQLAERDGRTEEALPFWRKAAQEPKS